MFKRFCIMVLSCAFIAEAQTSTQTSTTKPARKPVTPPPAKFDPDNIPLATIEVGGNRFYNANQVIGAAGVKIGQPMKQADFDAMKVRLEQTGAFEVVSYHYGPTSDGHGYALKIDVVEGLQLLPYRFEDLPAPDAELRKILEQKQPLFADRLPPSRTILDQFAATLTEYMKAKNFKDTVAGKVASEVPGGLSIVFAPATADPMVGMFTFKGHKIVDTSTIANAFAPVIIGTSSRERDVRALLDSGLRPIFESKGLMRVAFGKITTEKMKDADGVGLTIEVVEGPQFKFGDIRVTGLGLTNKEAMSQIEFKPGELANMDLAQAVTRKMRDRLVHYGYMVGDVTYDRKINDKALTVDLTFKLDCGKRYNMGDLTIVGLDLNSEPAIRKMWGLPQGKPYSGNYPQLFLDEIKSEGLFDNLKSMRYEDHVDKVKGIVSVTLYFVGGKDKPVDRHPGFPRNPQN
jgi:outer membrane protein insertion porin family